ncbi:MAG: hypothetical protein FJ271_25935 [Planctomycetes bacterium]|nr:hypothetical protein [Planctomycetota bacterium]
MGIVLGPENETAKELKRWDTPKRLGGMNADGKDEFPKMVYKADRWTNGKTMCGHPGVATGEPIATAFTAACQRTVFDGDEYASARRAAWYDSPELAIKAFEAAQRGVADAVAEEQYRVNRMSESAQAEFRDAQAGEEHVPDPPAPKKAPKGARR